jgi:hypothetical protein
MMASGSQCVACFLAFNFLNCLVLTLYLISAAMYFSLAVYQAR